MSTDAGHGSTPPLAGCRVVELAHTAAAAYAGRLLCAMGASVTMLEPPGGSPLRRAPPLLDGGNGPSALFAYLAAGKRGVVSELDTQTGRKVLDDELERADLFIEDTPVVTREGLDLRPQALAKRHPHLIHVSVLPFGDTGPKADWQAEEINLLHASGEGFLLPNGLSQELFPGRPPLKIYGHFAGYQGGTMAALAALSAWWAAPRGGGQHVDVSVQDATLAVGAFALQRLGDGSLEHRATRRFRYGGVFRTTDGYVELLTLEERQWTGLVQLLGHPQWATDPALADPLERSRRGDEINGHIRAWMAQHPAEEVVRRAQQAGVPVGKYRPPGEVVGGEHERARDLFARLTWPDGRSARVLRAPFRFTSDTANPAHPVQLDEALHVPVLGEHGSAGAPERP